MNSLHGSSLSKSIQDLHAIACVTSTFASGEVSRGTGTHVGAGYFLTALHVVAALRAELEFSEAVELKFPGAEPLFGAVMPTLYDCVSDWVVLRIFVKPVRSPLRPEDIEDAPLLDELIAKLPSIPMSEITSQEVGPWATYGYPTFRQTGMNFVGELRGIVPFEDTEAMQLFSLEASAGAGVPIGGLSGAPVIVKRSLVGVIRSAILDRQSFTVAGTLFASPINLLGVGVGDGSRFPKDFPSLDIYRGLPGVPRRDLPQRPFRYLERYRERDAEVFFGRGAALFGLYNSLTTEDAPPIILTYGQSGIGKSSLLESGLIPRLRSSHDVRYVRREDAGDLASALKKAIGASWHDIENRSGRPLLVILDQVEEAFTRTNTDPTIELRELSLQLQALFRESDTRPRGRLILSMRKEWLAEIQNVLESADLPYSNHFVDRLTHDEIVEVVEGLTLSTRLRRQYNVEIEVGLAGRIATDLTSDPASALSPMLQIWLTRLWEACQDASGRRRLTLEAYERLRREEAQLSDFVRLQLQTLGSQFQEQLDSGLIEDILEFYTSRIETAKSRIAGETEERYQSQPGGHLAALLNALVNAFLLTSLQTSKGLAHSLSHDTLAPVVRARFQESQRFGQRARRILEARVAQGGDSPPLDVVDLELVEQGRRGMRDLTPTESSLIERSKAVRAKRRFGTFGSLAITTIAIVTLLILVLPQARIPAFHQIHRQTLDFAADAALSARPEYASRLGNVLQTSYDCDWYQGFESGAIVHPSSALFGLNPGKFERTAFVLQQNDGGHDDRWYWYHDRPVTGLAYTGLNRFMDIMKKAIASRNEFGLQTLANLDSAKVATQTLCCTDTDRQVQGGMAFLYATLNLRRALGVPNVRQFQSSVLIRTYEHGYVLAGVGGYPLESDVIEILLSDKGASDRGIWYQLIQKPLFGTTFRPNCVAGTS